MFPGFKPENHPHQIKRRGVADDVDDRETPPCVYVPLDAEFHFTLDAAASHDNKKCPRYCTLAGCFETGPEPRQIWAGDGLAYPWGDHSVWLNPPFSRLRPWVEKAWQETRATVAMLLPNNRAEQPFWQQLIEPFRDRAGTILTTRNLAKRRPFTSRGDIVTTLGANGRATKSPPFGLVLVIWDRRGPSLG